MYHFVRPDKDSTIYEYAPDLNVGADEILELDRVVGEEARALLMFDVTHIDAYIDASALAFTARLRMYVTEASQLPTTYELAAYPLDRSWQRGTGRKFNEPQTPDGVTWRSAGDVPWDFPGADFDLDVRCAQSFDFDAADVDLDLTKIVKEWVTGRENNGIILIREQSDENASTLKYFGALTHTVYAPLLSVAYDDSVYAPSVYQQQQPALNPESEPIQVQATRVKQTYAADGIKRFRAIARPAYSKRQFVEDDAPVPRRLPESTLRYSITDVLNDRVIVPFSAASTMSLGPRGYYFDIDLRNIQPERQYEVAFRYESPTGYTETYSGSEFRVTAA